ncbi:DUF222 domain-containing protein [Mycobacterium sp. CPCC 205372]|uniref:DUF222 domain-containing protein n=1 Tax=Mycobacterium hippophais TaxID=3016340 RepID=A0ABT4PXC4_9MYCO|nr:HNH endonuclease signature motif containing protein [Mycobacterium hippophais]MCZ8381165.1 DUF222 domain-containing protein [Mycobacterium hippophais]
MDREQVVAALEAWDAARAAIAALPLDNLSAADLLAVYECRVDAHRQDAAVDHTVLAYLKNAFRPEVYGNTSLRDVLAQRLHLDTADVTRRLAATEALGPRWTLTGERLDPQWVHTAAALRAGAIDPAHVEVIRKCLKKVPGWVDATTRADAERDLAGWAQRMPPQDLEVAADYLLNAIDPDGAEPDHDEQQHRRYLVIGKQQPNGMTPIKGDLDPETAALLDVIIAKYGPPGQNLPEDPGAGETVPREVFGIADPRTRQQRHHDALKTALRDVAASGSLGQVNGVPATIVATTTVTDLESRAGYADTASGRKLPIRDLIRLAGQSQHYLAVFDDHTEEVLYFGRARRCASTAQRLALFARDKGCTRPGCTRPAFDCQVHHAQQDWREGGLTNTTDMALACAPDNHLIENTDWTTRRRNGRTEWIPPPPLDTGQTRVNNHHHPRRYLTDHSDDDGDAD